MNGVNPPSKSNYNIHSSGLSTGRVEKPLYKEGLEAYHEKLLLSAECYYSQGISCIPTVGKKLLYEFTKERYPDFKISFEEFKSIFNANKDKITGIAVVGGYNPHFKAFLLCLDIDDRAVFEKELLKSKISDIFFTTRVKTYRGYQHLLLSDYEFVGVEHFCFKGQRIGELRGTGEPWIVPPSDFLWRDRNNPEILLFYHYRFLNPIYPILRIGKEEFERIFEFFKVGGTQARIENINRSSSELIPETSERPDYTKEKIYQVEYSWDTEKGLIERFFYLLGYRYLCPFHEEKRKSFDFFRLQDGKWHGHCFHEKIDVSLGELYWWYLKAPESKARVKHEGRMKEDFFTALNKMVNALITNIDMVENILNSELAQKLVKRKRKANRVRYKNALIFILGVMLQKVEERLLPIDIISEITGLSPKESFKFLKQLGKKGFIKPLYKRKVKDSNNLIWTYEKGLYINTFFQKVTE